MSEYPPPRQPSSVYNSLDYTTFGSGGSSSSLNYPLAQGTETMGFGVVWGDGSYQNSAATDICNNSFVSYPTAQGQVSFPSGIVINGQSQTTAYTGYPTSFTPTAPNSLTLDSHGKITQIDNVDTNLNYVLNRGNDGGTLGMTNLGGISQFGAASNSLNYTEINTVFGASATPGLIVRDSNTQKQFNLLPNVTAGAYNPATEAGNIQILAFKGGSQGTETLELTTWSSINASVKINGNGSVEMGAGGGGVTGTSNIRLDGNSVQISPYLNFPDGTNQSSAFTGAGTLAGSYGLVSMAIDANGQITALVDEAATYAPLASPALTGVPTAPTAAASDNSTQIATTAYVTNAVASHSGGAGTQVTWFPTSDVGLTPGSNNGTLATISVSEGVQYLQVNLYFQIGNNTTFNDGGANFYIVEQGVTPGLATVTSVIPNTSYSNASGVTQLFSNFSTMVNVPTGGKNYQLYGIWDFTNGTPVSGTGSSFIIVGNIGYESVFSATQVA